jgi:hypothetical protein
MKRGIGLWVFWAGPAFAHVVSMSSGDLRIEGTHGTFELRMPLYEIAHTRSPERTLLDQIRFGAARRLSSSCQADPAQDLYICRAAYEFPSPPEQLNVECTLASVTVPNHVHLLRVYNGDKRDQGVFDISFSRTTLRFRPPTPAEIAAEEAGEGCMRALGGTAQILFLLAIVLAARSRLELCVLAGTFAAGQAASALLASIAGWQPTPRFIEAVAMLAVAYLAAEILLLPKAGARWLIVAVLGAVHGLFFHLSLVNSGAHAGYVLAGATLAQWSLLSIPAALFSWAEKMAHRQRLVQVSAFAVLAVSMSWFLLRLAG